MTAPGTLYAVRTVVEALRELNMRFSSVYSLSVAVSEEIGISDRTARRALSELEVADLVHPLSPGLGHPDQDLGQHVGQPVQAESITPAQAPDTAVEPEAENTAPYLPTALGSLGSPQQPHPTDAMRPLRKVIRNRKATWCVLCDADIEVGAGFIPVPYESCSPHCGSCWSTLVAMDAELSNPQAQVES